MEAQWVRSLDLTAHTRLSPIQRGFVPSCVNYKKGCTRLAVASDKVNQLLAQGRWFSPGTLASSTTKTGRHDIQNVAEILLKVALNTKNQSINQWNQEMEVQTSSWDYYIYVSIIVPASNHKFCERPQEATWTTIIGYQIILCQFCQ